MSDGDRGIVVFSGGSAANSLVDVFEAVRASKDDCELSYIIPISDNGGSSSEIIRVFGGPGIGDVRSRLVRLIPSLPPSAERDAISALFNRRLSEVSPTVAAAEWQDIVAGTSEHWRGIPPAKKELIRSFFNYLNLEVLKRSRPPTSTFDFSSASVGNLFLTGARLFSGSFESAIYLLSSLCQIPDGQVKVIPNITSNFQHHIAAGLANGEVILGQNNISHPSEATSMDVPSPQPQPHSATYVHGSRARQSLDGLVEDSYMPGTLAPLRQKNIRFSKDGEEDLPARIERIWYINPFGQEMLPPANPRSIAAVKHAQAIIFSIGSLYTSIVPSIILHGVGEALRQTKARHKILILNGSLDREVGPSSAPFTAFDFVEAIARAGEQSRGKPWPPMPDSPSSLAMLQPPITPTISQDGLTILHADPGRAVYREYVTHVIHLSGEGTPVVDQKCLATVGIDCLKLYGRKSDTGKGMHYDAQALIGAIQAILGRKGEAMMASRSRRNTFDT
ncbi:hypothetical protein DV735_g2440, partial [Chaetothyriales sp. CBS 134920]